MGAEVLELRFRQMPLSCGYCGVSFSMPESLYRARLKDREAFWCPNGHQRIFVGKSEVDLLKEQLAEKDRSIKWEREAKERARLAEDLAKRCAAAARGQVTRIKNRVGNGVCPCCNRTFINLQRHMTTKHPAFANKGASES